MQTKRLLIGLSFLLCFLTNLNAQIEYGFLSSKQFSGNGGAAVFNISAPINDADYFSGEFGIGMFSNDENNVVIVPLLAGYRYTIDRSGIGFYLEPNLGYSFGGTDVPKLDANGQQIWDSNAGKYLDVKCTGLTTGANIGYLFKPSEGRFRVQWNICLRYEHTFSELSTNMFSLRITHAFSFGRRD